MSRVKLTLAIGILALGLLTAFAPGHWILTPAHLLFFDTVPRWLWGLIQVLVAVAVLVTGERRATYRSTASFLLAIVCFTWAFVAIYPSFLGQPWNVVSLVAWIMLGTIALLTRDYGRVEHRA